MTTSDPTPEVTGFSFRWIATIALVAVALAAAALAAVAPSREVLVAAVDAAPALQRMQSGVTGEATPVSRESTAPAAEQPDAAVLAHEALDPVGVGQHRRPAADGMTATTGPRGL